MNISMQSNNQSASVRKRDQSSFFDSGSPSKLSTSKSGPAPVLDPLSSSKLQHSLLTYKFPKAERFPPIKEMNKSQSSINLPSTRNKRTTSFGYGHKILMSEIVIKNGWDVPAPTHYDPKEWTEGNSRGRSFGLSYEAYRKVYNPHLDQILPEISKEQPGPGAYQLFSGFGKTGKQITLKPKGKMFNELIKSEAPAPNNYFPNRSLVEPSRYKGTYLGYGERSDFTKDGNLSPGPGAYQIKSKFDQYGEKRIIEERLKQRLKLLNIK